MKYGTSQLMRLQLACNSFKKIEKQVSLKEEKKTEENVWQLSLFTHTPNKPNLTHQAMKQINQV